MDRSEADRRVTADDEHEAEAPNQPTSPVEPVVAKVSSADDAHKYVHSGRITKNYGNYIGRTCKAQVDKKAEKNCSDCKKVTIELGLLHGQNYDLAQEVRQLKEQQERDLAWTNQVISKAEHVIGELKKNIYLMENNRILWMEKLKLMLDKADIIVEDARLDIEKAMLEGDSFWREMEEWKGN